MYNGSASAVEKLSENSIKWVDSIYNILSIQIMYLSQQLAIIYQSQANIGGKRIYKLIVLIIRHSFLHYFDTNFNWIFDSNSNYCNTNKNVKFSKLQIQRKTERDLQSITYFSCHKTEKPAVEMNEILRSYYIFTIWEDFDLRSSVKRSKDSSQSLKQWLEC